MSSEGLVLGFNSCQAVCVAGDGVLVGAGAGIVTRRNADSIHWTPVDGRYLVSALVYSPVSRLLCLTEVRLNVVLHVFRYPEWNSVQKIEDIARVNVQDMSFSQNGQLLAILSRIPSTRVTVFSVQRGHALQKCTCIELADKFWTHLVFSPHRVDSLAVVESQGVSIVTQLSLVTCEPDVVTLNSRDRELHSCTWGEEGVICGARDGLVVLFDQLKMEMSDYITCPTNNVVTALLHINGLLLMGTDGGNVFGYNVDEKELRLLLDVKHSVDRILPSESGSEVLVVSRSDIRMLEPAAACAALIRVRGTGNTIKVVTVGSFVVLVCADGSLVRYQEATNTVVHTGVEFKEKAMDACTIGDHVIVVYDSGYVRCHTLNPVFVVSSHMKLGDTPLVLCAGDNASSLAVSDGNVIFLLTVEDNILVTQQKMDTLAGGVTNIRWITDGANRSWILVAFGHGEVQLVQCFSDDSTGLQRPYMTVEAVWRLDYPVRDFLPLYIDDDVVNIFVHSLDNDTKLYMLERRREGDAKLLRPLFLMRDHESGGNVLQWLSDTTILSGGRDGRVVVRDIAHYLLRLASIPPSKEKRRPLREFLVRHSWKKGITSLCVLVDKGVFACAGDDTVVHMVPCEGSVKYRWNEPFWHEEALPPSSDDTTTSVNGDVTAAELLRNNVMIGMSDLRMEMEELLKERTPAARVEDFLLPGQRELFNLECQAAIDQAKVDDYYHLLYNEYIQHIIRSECWEAMEVPLSKIVSLNDPTLEVHNFHRRKPDPVAEKLLKKIKFLRLIQKKSGDFFTFSSSLRRSKDTLQVGVGRDPDLSDDKGLLYDPIDVYTFSRAVIQIYLLTGEIIKVKKVFNARFDSLRERKSSELSCIEERNDRCKRIMRQLGEATLSTGALFAPVVDREENPRFVFEVLDTEIDPELLKLADRENTSAHVISASEEAALKTWMDGLEKDAEVLTVNVPMPPFADQTLEQYVAPDERTDEQQKAYTEYEKQLAEQTLYITGRKTALREEMMDLKRANVSAAKKVDEEIILLRKQRINTSSLVDELESHQVNALGRLFLQKRVCNDFSDLMREKTELQQRQKQLQSLESHKRNLLADAEKKLQQIVEHGKTLVARLRYSPPFNDNEWGDRLYKRFTRWRTRYDEGTAKVPLVEQHDPFPVALWELYCNCCSIVVEEKNAVSRGEAVVHSLTKALSEVELEVERLNCHLKEKENAEECFRRNAVQRIIDLPNMFLLRQSQVQDEDAVVNADFLSFSFKWETDILDYNSLVFASFDELRRLMNTISQQRQAIKMCSWDIERLQYCVGTLEMELRQLHTLRVTRQMQDNIHTGALLSHEDEINKLNRQIEYVRHVMSRRVEERNRVIARLNMQVNDRNVENNVLSSRVKALNSIVDDKKAVWATLGEHSNEESRLRRRMRGLRENSELEELARCQQEELLRLKREVDRLRERTFPSFAVVSKKRMH